MTLLAIFILLVFLYSLVSGFLDRTILTAPIVFTTAGIVVCLITEEMGIPQKSQEVFLGLAELGLVLLLFSDASRTNLQVLSNIRNLPTRLLTAGMLLTLLLGTLAAQVVFPGLSLWEAGILAAILAPTDAGLGQIIVNSPLVPMKIRQALNVEAGLNDGLSVPFLLFFIALAGTAAGGQAARLHQFVLEQLGYGAIIGIAVGLVGGWLLGLAHRKKTVLKSWEQLGVVAIPVLCLVFSEFAGASMFIAAFVAGLAVQAGFKEAGKHSVDFTEEWGQMINLSVFFLFGILFARNWPNLSMQHLLYAILSVTLIRMLPVAISLIGTRMSRATIVFMGWFGPRGLASIVLGLVYLEHGARHPGESTIRLATMATVALSIFAHGLSARPGIGLYAARISRLSRGAPELESR